MLLVFHILQKLWYFNCNLHYWTNLPINKFIFNANNICHKQLLHVSQVLVLKMDELLLYSPSVIHFLFLQLWLKSHQDPSYGVGSLSLITKPNQLPGRNWTKTLLIPDAFIPKPTELPCSKREFSVLEE